MSSAFDDANDYRAALRIPIVDESTTLFVNAGTGTENPTFVERFGFTPDTFIGNPELRPERSRSLSATVEHSFGRNSGRTVAIHGRSTILRSRQPHYDKT